MEHSLNEFLRYFVTWSGLSFFFFLYLTLHGYCYVPVLFLYVHLCDRTRHDLCSKTAMLKRNKLKALLWLPWSMKCQSSLPSSKRYMRCFSSFQGRAHHRTMQSSVLRSIERNPRICQLLDRFYQLALGSRKSWHSSYVFAFNAGSSSSQKR